MHPPPPPPRTQPSLTPPSPPLPQNTFVPGHIVGCTRIFNIMDACDPVSYRIEDSCDAFIRTGRPLQPPCPVDPLWSLTIARDKVNEKLAVVKDVVRDVKTKLFQIFKVESHAAAQAAGEQQDASPSPLPLPPPSATEMQRNAASSAAAAALRLSQEDSEGRLDFVLRKTVKEGVNAAFAHRSYWFSKDTMLFCLSNMLERLASPALHHDDDDSTGLTDSDTDDEIGGGGARSLDRLGENRRRLGEGGGGDGCGCNRIVLHKIKGVVVCKVRGDSSLLLPA